MARRRAARTGAAGAPTPDQTVRRNARVMPWVLVAAALAVGAAAFLVRDQRHTDSVTVTRAAKPSPGAPASSSQLPPEKETTIDRATSDTTFATILGIAALLLILGAFYARVSKITVAGNSVEMAATQDAPAVAEVVAKQAEQKVREVSTDGKLTVAEAMSIARAVAEAAASTQARATRMRLAGTIGPPAGSLATEAQELRVLSPDAPLPDSVLKRLAATVMDARQPDG